VVPAAGAVVEVPDPVRLPLHAVAPKYLPEHASRKAYAVVGSFVFGSHLGSFLVPFLAGRRSSHLINASGNVLLSLIILNFKVCLYYNNIKCS
jgi:hypothetical protein